MNMKNLIKQVLTKYIEENIQMTRYDNDSTKSYVMSAKEQLNDLINNDTYTYYKSNNGDKYYIELNDMKLYIN